MKEIIKQLEHITSSGHSHYNVFSDWLDLMLYALMSNDDEYLKIVGRYKNNRKQGEREIDYFANAFGLLLVAMKESNDEQLGEIYMSWNISNKYTGQFFTPKHIASLMAMITDPKGGNISDMACGAGMMLVETAKVIDSENLYNSLFIAQDLDNTCVRMCALNMTFFNLNAYIIQGNSLLMDDYQRVFKTTRTNIGGAIRELSKEEIEVIKPKIITAQKSENKQLALF